MTRYVKVGKVGDITSGQAKVVTVNNKQIAIFNQGGSHYAIDDACTHRGGPLSEGFCDDGIVTCPWHSAQFRLDSGEAVGPPASRGVTSYRVRTTDGEVEIEI